MPNNLADDLYIYSGNYLCRKYDYRYIGTIDNIRIYGKPIGYAILKAEVNDTSIHISLIIKGIILKDGSRPNETWKSITTNINTKDSYFSYIDIIKEVIDRLYNRNLRGRIVRHHCEVPVEDAQFLNN